MSDPQDTGPAPELTPEARMVMARARRSFFVSIGLLILGLMAVGGAIVYRSAQNGATSGGGDYVIAALKIPEGSTVVSAVAADGKLTVTYQLGPMTSVRVFDGRTGEMLREIPVVSD